MRALVLLAIAAPLVGQEITATLSIVKSVDTRAQIGKRLAKRVSEWTVSLEAPEATQVSESAVLRRIPQLNPLDHTSVLQIALGTERRSLPRQAANATEDLAKLGSYLMASRSIAVPAIALTALTGYVALAPDLIARIRGQATPVADNLAALVWAAPATLGPGQAVTAHVFTAPWPDNSPSFTITIPIAPLPAVKVAQ